MSARQGAFGCNLDLKPFMPNSKVIYSSNNIIQATLTQMQPYYFVKGFMKQDDGSDNTFREEKQAHQTFLGNLQRKDGIPQELKESAAYLQQYLLSIFGADMNVSENYTITTNALASSALQGGVPSCRSGRPVITRYGEIPVIVMRKLGRNLHSVYPEIKAEGDLLSTKTFYNFIQKVSLLNTFFVQFDLHGGNLLYNIETRELNIIDMGLGRRPSESPIYAPHMDIWYRGFEDHPEINTQNNLFTKIVNATKNWPSFWTPFTNGTALGSDPSYYFDLWGLLWSREMQGSDPKGELYAFEHRGQTKQYNILMMATNDLYAISIHLYSYHDMFYSSTLVRLFAILFSWPNPLLRPFSFNVVKFFKKLLKLESNKLIHINTSKANIVSFESRMGIGKTFDMTSLLNYSSKYVNNDPDSIWQTDGLLKRFAKFNYYAMCWQIISYMNTIKAMTSANAGSTLVSLKNSHWTSWSYGGAYYFDRNNSEDEKWRSMFSRRKMEAFFKSLTRQQLQEIESTALESVLEEIDDSVTYTKVEYDANLEDGIL